MIIRFNFRKRLRNPITERMNYSAWVEQAKASKGVSYNAFPKFVAPKCDEDLLEDPAVRDELLARRGYAKEMVRASL